MKVTEYCVSISKALITIDRELPIGEPVSLLIEGEVFSDKTIPNHDGSELIKVFIIKGAIAEVRSQGKVISEEHDNL